ncbi:MAG: hypothetical protein J6T82_08525 [Bacteroidaceae bacterium]|nr:hypothetical protein [Bacteroidaceae bacterium]
MRKEEKIFVLQDDFKADELRRDLYTGLNQLRRIGEILQGSGIILTNEVINDCIRLKRAFKQGGRALTKNCNAGSLATPYEVISVWENAEHLFEAFEEAHHKTGNTAFDEQLSEQREKLFEKVLKITEKINEHGRAEILLSCACVIDGQITARADFEDEIKKATSVYIESDEALKLMKLHQQAEAALNRLHEAIPCAIFDVQDIFETLEDGTIRLVPFDYNRFV